jgi:hypothetical protein
VGKDIEGTIQMLAGWGSLSASFCISSAILDRLAEDVDSGDVEHAELSAKLEGADSPLALKNRWEQTFVQRRPINVFGPFATLGRVSPSLHSRHSFHWMSPILRAFRLLCSIFKTCRAFGWPGTTERGWGADQQLLARQFAELPFQH